MICGIDEAGRGTLAGPMVVVGVVDLAPLARLGASQEDHSRRAASHLALLNQADPTKPQALRALEQNHADLARAGGLASIAKLADSKKLSRKMRQALEAPIKENSRFEICVFSNTEIDKRGISACLRDALERIKAAIKADEYIYDGNCSYGVGGIKTLVGADKTVREVSAASILAKLTKDKILLELAGDYPGFSFAAHQGYGTKKHIQEIIQNGYSPLHRKTFKIKALQ